MDGHRWSATMMMALVSVGLGACGADVEPFGDGELALQWEVAPMGCDAAGVEDVAVTLTNEMRTIHERFQCDRQAVVIDSINPGTYDLVLEGRDESNQATFRGAVDGLLVRPDVQTEPGTVDLVAVASSAVVQWWFEDSLVCNANRVGDVEITVYDSAHHEVHRSTADCEKAEAKIDGLHSGLHLFRVRAFEAGQAYQGVREVELTRGQQVEVEIAVGNVDAQ